MTHEELLQIAFEAQPAVMEKVAAMTYLTEKLDSEVARQCTEDFKTILDRASSGMEKVSALTPLQAAGLSVAGSIAGALGTALSADLYDAAKKGLTASRNFNNILKHNPELESSFKKEDLRRAFNSIHKMGPEFTADPTLGGQLLFAASRSPESLPHLLKDLVATRKNILDAKHRQFSPHFTAAEAYQQALERSDARAERAAEKALEKSERELRFQSSREYADILNEVRPKVIRTVRHEYAPSSQVYHRER